MTFKAANEFYNVMKECDVQSLYKATQEFGKLHHYLTDDSGVNIDKTSQTIMEAVLESFKNTDDKTAAPVDKQREEKIKDFCYIYGGYIAYRLRCKWIKLKLQDIPVRDELISVATFQVINSCIKSIEKNGYKKGSFSHLIHKSIFNKFIDVQDKYNTWVKKNSQDTSFETIEDIVGGKVPVEIPVEEEDERLLDASGIYGVLKRVKTKHTQDDYEMFVQYYDQGRTLEELAEEFELSPATVSRRIREFAAAAKEIYEQIQKELEDF